MVKRKVNIHSLVRVTNPEKYGFPHPWAAHVICTFLRDPTKVQITTPKRTGIIVDVQDLEVIG